MSDAIEILGAMLGVIDEAGVAEVRATLARLGDETRSIVRGRGERAARLLGLVAVDPALVEAVRRDVAEATSHVRPWEDGPSKRSKVDAMTQESRLALADAVLSQLAQVGR